MSIPDAADRLKSWIDRNNIKILNVAGARARKDPKIYQATIELLARAFSIEEIP